MITHQYFRFTPHRLFGWIRQWRIGLMVLALLAPVMLEVVNVVQAWWTVRHTAEMTMRYAVTGEYDANYCANAIEFYKAHNQNGELTSSYITQANIARTIYWNQVRNGLDVDGPSSSSSDYGCMMMSPQVNAAPTIGDLTTQEASERTFALQNFASLRTIEAIAHNLLADNQIASESITFEICRLAQFDMQNRVCLSANQLGGAGETIVTNVRYSYPLGSALGLGVAILPLQATQTGIMESFRRARDVVLPSDTDSTPIQTTGALPDAASAERLVVVNGQIQLMVTDVQGRVEQIAQLAQAANGYVVQSTLGAEGEQYQAQIQLRVPATQFQLVVGQVKELAIEVLVETQTGQDVTEEYVDLDSRLRSLQATATRVETLLQQAQTVTEALQVNAELSRLQEQIEQIQGRKLYLENQAALATLTVNLSTERPQPTLAPIVWQPGATVEKAGRFLLTGVYLIGDVLIWVGMVGLPLLVIVWGVAKSIRRLRA